MVATGQPPYTPHRAEPWPEYGTPASPVVGCAGSLGLPHLGLALDRHRKQRGRGGYGASRGCAEAVYNRARKLPQRRIQDHNDSNNSNHEKEDGNANKGTDTLSQLVEDAEMIIE